MAQLGEVFGVSKDQVLSYVQRTAVDDSFTTALKEDKQIVVYGASKQGKTALVRRYLPYEENIVVQLSPKFEVEDIYRTVLHAAGVQIAEQSTTGATGESSVSGKLTFKAMIPFFGGGGTSAEAKNITGDSTSQTFTEVPLNLSLPNDVAGLLSRVGNKKSVILENFHYLNDSKQRQLAFDLRTFQELGVRFVILGVWREKNRLSQFNGDLLDRVHEVPVEPWLEEDFDRVARRGESELNIVITDEVLTACKNASFSSIGVLQELLKQTCQASGVGGTQVVTYMVNDLAAFETARAKKAYDYASRHERALEAIATGNPTGGGRGDAIPLFLPYYLVRVLCDYGYEGIASGMRRGGYSGEHSKHSPSKG